MARNVTQPAAAGDDALQPGGPSVLDPGTRQGRIRLALVLLALIPVTLWWLERAIDAPANGWFEGATTFEIGSDFTVFYTAGALVADGESDVIYDVDAFQQQYVQRIDLPVSANSSFGNTPAFAVLVAPLSAFSWQVAWVVWTAVGLVALVGALALLGLRRPARAALLFLLTLPVYFAITFGQGALLWLLIVSAMFVAFSRQRIGLGGALAGLLILKPTLLVGFGLWWLLDRRTRPALTVAAASAAAIVVVTLPLVGSAWLDFPAAALDFADRHSTLDAQWAQFSPWGFFNLLLPDLPVLATILGAAAAAAGVAGFAWFYRRHRHEPSLLFAAAIVATLWISPQVVAYEWTLLIAVGVILWQSRPAWRQQWLAIGIVLAVAAVWSILLSNEMRPGVGWAFQFAVPTHGVAAWWVARKLTEPVSA